MNQPIITHTESSYRQAEEKAIRYFESLYSQVIEKGYIPTLTQDFHTWKKTHIRHPLHFAPFSFGKKRAEGLGYYAYIQWLSKTGKLDHYLDRSISYIYMRDLGKALDEMDTQASITRAVEKIKEHILSEPSDEADSFNQSGLYRWAQKEGVESATMWVLHKLKRVSDHIPVGMDADHAQRKLIKTIAGVIMHAVEEMDDSITGKVRSKKVDEAIRLGYSYGLTYPFIDDLLDANILTPQEEKRYSNLIRTSLVTRNVPKLGEWQGKNKGLIDFIHAELKEAFEYIKRHQNPETIDAFFEQSYVFFHAQEVDRDKDLSNRNYTNEELFIPIILKSSSSRLIVRSVISAEEDQGFDRRTFYYGIYNQLADDFTDMFDDLKEGAVTPYTYYLTYHESRPDLINPFELYWTVISHLIHEVYHNDPKTCEVILDRAINGLKRYKNRMGSKTYNEVMQLFSSGHSAFNHMIQQLVRKADEVDFFDKLLRDHIILSLKDQKQEQEEFLDIIEKVREQVNTHLPIAKGPLSDDNIVDGANYSLIGDGKRLRPILTWVMGVKEFGLSASAIVPLLKSLEYMHTASLIFDDLPSQDNASIRRGNPTLHEVHNVAVAELTGLFLTQKAIEEQTCLDQFDSKVVLQLIQYTAQMTADMCKGQVMDLEAKGKRLSLQALNQMCFYKTGIGFEASLIMPAILAQANDTEIKAWKTFAYHAGIAFQIKDDLLDVEGDQQTLGKPIGNDVDHDKSTYVSVLGVEGAKKEMWEHYCTALELLYEISPKTPFLKHFLHYIVNRDH
ncbi:polyprenyl synthetase family protein [Aquibacillus koreensis]|uniref:Polyprenyl synthetase family protein n=1 Tax=Aquibacillus koreensis TaxID=279446 RepID=A0A9X4AJ92_9BACI|nr:polyprenyl synthetase family protein [Aquibacillus koreensis]MCT2534474.1 polyprenyl synthetase family protein [Aquibacillus koreensis]MDC3421781.1 polyprenyl synthetase family protein [Aquibacillus koreensis]